MSNSIIHYEPSFKCPNFNPDFFGQELITKRSFLTTSLKSNRTCFSPRQENKCKNIMLTLKYQNINPDESGLLKEELTVNF